MERSCQIQKSSKKALFWLFFPSANWPQKRVKKWPTRQKSAKSLMYFFKKCHFRPFLADFDLVFVQITPRIAGIFGFLGGDPKIDPPKIIKNTPKMTIFSTFFNISLKSIIFIKFRKICKFTQFRPIFRGLICTFIGP